MVNKELKGRKKIWESNEGFWKYAHYKIRCQQTPKLVRYLLYPIEMVNKELKGREKIWEPSEGFWKYAHYKIRCQQTPKLAGHLKTDKLALKAVKHWLIPGIVISLALRAASISFPPRPASFCTSFIGPDKKNVGCKENSKGKRTRKQQEGRRTLLGLADAKECIPLFDSTSFRLSPPRQVVRCLAMNHQMQGPDPFSYLHRSYPVALVSQPWQKPLSLHLVPPPFSSTSQLSTFTLVSLSCFLFLIIISIFVVALRVRLCNQGGEWLSLLHSSLLRPCLSYWVAALVIVVVVIIVLINILISIFNQ